MKKINKIIILLITLLFFVLIPLSSCRTNQELLELDTDNNYNLITLLRKQKALEEREEKLIEENKELKKQIEAFKEMQENIESSIIENEKHQQYLFDLYKEIVNNILYSTVRVEAYGYKEKLIGPDEYIKGTGSGGSGFIFYENDDYYYILTNEHVVKEASSADYTKRIIITYDGITATAKYICGNIDTYDMAVLRVAKSDIGYKYEPLKLSSDPKENDYVFAIGSPENFKNSVAIGKVIKYLTIKITNSPYTYWTFNHSCFALGGSSGGAVINTSFEVVGINSWGLTDGNYNNYSGKASPVSRIKEFLEKNNLNYLE